jgi:hypothetical protein
MIDLGLQPVDRVGQADYIPYYPEMPLVVGKTIIVNRRFEQEQENIQELSKHNKIINRVPDYLPGLEVQKYQIDDLMMNNYESGKINITEVQKSGDIRVILLDDLILTNKRLCLEWN